MGRGISPVSLERQATPWTPPEENISGAVGTSGTSGNPFADAQLTKYTGTYTINNVPAPGTTPPLNKPFWNFDGFNGAIYITVQETAGGTATVNLEGSDDNQNWLLLGYYIIVNAGATALAPARAVAALSITANSWNRFQILDAYPLMRVRPTANTGAITATSYSIPV